MVNIVSEVDNFVSVKNVIVSVSNKNGLEKFIPGIVDVIDGVRIYSTGGTYTYIEKILGEKASKHLIQISDYTGQPETQGGLVKTLDFKIYLGILTEKYNEAHQSDLLRTNAVAIDMVVVNLYPFKETIQKENVTIEEARANIDIGGPCMLRASAKNYLRVASVCDPDDYDMILSVLRKYNGKIDIETRFKLAVKTFTHTALYDNMIASYLGNIDPAGVKDCYVFKDR